MKNKLKNILFSTVLFILLLLVTEFIAVVFIRISNKSSLGQEFNEFLSETNLLKLSSTGCKSTADLVLGFKPVCNNKCYSEYCTRINRYDLKKRPGVKRILFIGDSVTARAAIIKELQNIYGDQKFEYWNAGVEGYNTEQEVAFYKKYNVFIKPDHVILTFVYNDFYATPVIFSDQDNKVLIFTPDIQVRYLNRVLLKSALYRVAVRIIAKFNLVSQKSRSFFVKNSLAELRSILGRDGIRLTVLVMPILKRYELWSAAEKQSRAQVLEFLNDLHIKHFDLLYPLNVALDDGFPIQRYEKDPIHPNEDISSIFAEYLLKNRLLE